MKQKPKGIVDQRVELNFRMGSPPVDQQQSFTVQPTVAPPPPQIWVPLSITAFMLAGIYFYTR